MDEIVEHEKIQEKTPEKTAEERSPKEKAPTTDDPKDRNPTEGKTEEEAPSLVDKALLAAGELRKATDEQKKQNDRTEKLQADAIASGRGQMVPAQTPVPETDTEYAARFERGEANPLKDD